jgi:D-hydroxyproline dehydrogenase subunit beta
MSGSLTSTNFDAIIAGGGIIGSACAAWLSRAGLRVALVERNTIGSGTTSAGMGHIVVLDDSEAQFALTRFSQQLWHELAPKLPAAAEFQPAGTVWVAADAEEMAEAERKHAYYTSRGVPAALLSAGELAAREPNLRPGLAGGLLVLQDAIAHPPAVALHFAEEARALGATLILGRSITSLAHGEAVLDSLDGGLDGGSDRRTAPRLINATCGWATELDASLPIRKRKGHLALTESYPGFVRHQVVELGYIKSAHVADADSVAFNVQPRPTGQIYIGASRQFGSEDTAVEAQILDAMLARAAAFMPAIAQMKIAAARAGFRAATPDNLPLIGPAGPAAEDETLWLATGHEGLGITASLGTAALITASITGTTPPIPPEPYLPARFRTAAPSHDASPQH